MTGGGTGIGAAIARAYASAGAAVTVVGRRLAPLDAVVAEITATGGRALACPGDVTDLEQMENAASAAVEAFGHIDLVVANAGAAPPMGGVLDADEASWRAIVDLNLTGVWITAKATVPRLVAHGGGAFVTIGSGAARGELGRPGLVLRGQSRSERPDTSARRRIAPSPDRGERDHPGTRLHGGDRGLRWGNQDEVAAGSVRARASGSSDRTTSRSSRCTSRRCRRTARPVRSSA